MIYFSNICNLVAQQTGFLRYKVAYEKEIRDVRRNNLDPSQEGNLYPFVLLEYASEKVQFERGGIVRHANIRLNFFTTTYRDNSGAATDITLLEQQEELREKAHDFLFLLFTETTKVMPKFAFTPNVVNLDVEHFTHGDNLLQLAASFTVQLKKECPTATLNTGIIAPPYAYPPSFTDDYERTATA